VGDIGVLAGETGEGDSGTAGVEAEARPIADRCLASRASLASLAAPKLGISLVGNRRVVTSRINVGSVSAFTAGCVDDAEEVDGAACRSRIALALAALARAAAVSASRRTRASWISLPIASFFGSSACACCRSAKHDAGTRGLAETDAPCIASV
jgi:hypothetical protein